MMEYSSHDKISMAALFDTHNSPYSVEKDWTHGMCEIRLIRNSGV
jgi:hypothetical protein